MSPPRWTAALSLALAAALAACSSPEATRARGGGPGGDTGNRDELVRMHEGSDPYWQTPRLLGDQIGAPVVTAGDGESRGRAPAASPR